MNPLISEYQVTRTVVLRTKKERKNTHGKFSDLARYAMIGIHKGNDHGASCELAKVPKTDLGLCAKLSNNHPRVGVMFAKAEALRANFFNFVKATNPKKMSWEAFNKEYLFYYASLSAARRVFDTEKCYCPNNQVCPIDKFCVTLSIEIANPGLQQCSMLICEDILMYTYARSTFKAIKAYRVKHFAHS